MAARTWRKRSVTGRWTTGSGEWSIAGFGGADETNRPCGLRVVGETGAEPATRLAQGTSPRWIARRIAGAGWLRSRSLAVRAWGVPVPKEPY